ncbi:lipase (class 3) [Arenicella xantha]|uniref:Lipase (Class 3) n=2 Tax=Arenicella xantha TaxID=644221 RepID=A0A395JKM7_9GAMM|nr:lipase (class 3) [Arenicella xantha]
MLHTNTSNDNSSVVIDPNLASLAGQASAAAYADYAHSNDPAHVPAAIYSGAHSYSYLMRFSGFDAVAWGSGKEERFGLVYQSTKHSDEYLFAFRGTSSVYDMWEDLDSTGTTEFRPHQPSKSFPNDIQVGAGFNRLYSSKSMSMSASMQQQLFNTIKALPQTPKKIFITGHSLGSALASLFTLDLATSQPSIELFAINFASPRVGTRAWQKCYDTQYRLKDSTIRIRNNYDLITNVPFDAAPFNFQHVGTEFEVSFTVDSYMHDPVIIIEAWHSLSNYRYVVDRATMRSPEIWLGEFFDQAITHTSWPMTSYAPDQQSLNWEQGNLMKVRRDLEAVADYM